MKTYHILYFVALGYCSEIVEIPSDKGVAGLNIGWSKLDGMCTVAWTYYEKGINAPKDQWGTCLPSSKKIQDCSLETHYYPTNYVVNMVFLNITMNVRICSTFNNIIGRKCVQYITLSAYIGSGTGKKKYNIIKKLPTDVSKLTPDKDGYVVHNELVPIGGLAEKNGIQLIFHTSQFCGGITQADLFYYKCPAASKELISFKSQPAPEKSVFNVTIPGVCADHAVSNTSIKAYMNCFYNGTSNVYGSCICDKGYTRKVSACKGIFKYLNWLTV